MANDVHGESAQVRTCDAHMHVFGDVADYPPAAGASYRPPPCTIDKYLRIAGQSAIGRFVLVQPSVYGDDNRCLLDALAAVGRERARGVVAVAGKSPSRPVLTEWRDLGVCGLRIIGFPPDHRRHAAGELPEPGKDFMLGLQRELDVTAELAADIGWHVDILAPGSVLLGLSSQLAGLPVDYSIAHLGLAEAPRGVHQPAFQAVLDLASSGTRRCWIKLTAPYRLLSQPPYNDVVPLVNTVLDQAPDRLVLGSDFPHVQFAEQVSTADLLGTMRSWLRSQEIARQVLEENPAVLYGFPRDPAMRVPRPVADAEPA